jgi:HlyD family secretion protein
VTIRRWGGEGELEGHVRLVEPSAFTRTSALGVEEQRVNAIIDLDSPREQWARLGDGYRVETQIRIWEADDVLRAPGSAVFRRGDGWAAYRVVGDQVEEVALTTGQRNGMFVQVEEGLSEGDRVVAHPSDRVVPGARIVER